MTPDRLTRWRMLLGPEAEPELEQPPQGKLQAMDDALTALYEAEDSRRGGLGASKPQVHRWLGDIRRYFPASVAQLMQQDAVERLGLKRLLADPEWLETVTPDVSLVAQLLSLREAIPPQSRESARQLVRKVVDDLQAQLTLPAIRSLRGALARQERNPHPRRQEIDWLRTIRANLRHYQPEFGTIIPERLIGFGRRGQGLRDLILCVDQSGSMAPSLVYASIFGSVLAQLPALNTRMVVFDTAVVDLTEHLHDPVDLLFGTQLGGGTNIRQALAYCQSLVTRPRETLLVLISDLFEGSRREETLQLAEKLTGDGVQLICLLALSDRGKPAYDRNLAAALSALGAPVFACTPDRFPDLMARAINREPLSD